jgi:small subunit ribosomal protein S9
MAKRSKKEEDEAVENAAPEAEQPRTEGEAGERVEAPQPAAKAEPADVGEPAAEIEPAGEAPAAETEPEGAPPAAIEPAAEETPPDAEATVPPARAEEREPPKPADLSAEASYSATGKRKSSVARVILKAGRGSFELNGRALDNYFPRRTLQEVVRQPLKATGYLDRVDVRARIHGGGISSQADALRHGIAKALIEADPHLRGELKRRQLLTRDPRVKERRKAGLKKARKRPQFSKR